MNKFAQRLLGLVAPFKFQIATLGFVGFLSSAVLTGFYVTHLQQKAFAHKVFQHTPKFDYAFDYQTNVDGRKKFRYAYFMDWVPLYSRIKDHYAYNLLFNGSTREYDERLQKLALFSNARVKANDLENLFAVFDVSKTSIWNPQDTKTIDAAIRALTTVSVDPKNHFHYRVQPDVLVQFLQQAWSKTAAQNKYRQVTSRISLLLKSDDDRPTNDDYNDLEQFIRNQLVVWISSTVAKIFNDTVLQQLTGSDPPQQISELNDKLHKVKFPFEFSDSGRKNGGTNANNNKELLYQFIFGKCLEEGKKNLHPPYLRLFALSDQGDETKAGELLTPGERFKTGLRGMINPITSNKTFFANGDTLFNDLLLVSNNHMNTDRFKRHITLAGKLTGCQVVIRCESIIHDFQQEKVYRLVFLDASQNYAQPFVISGRAPLLPNEIMLSPGFARSNHIKLNSWMSVVGLPLHVVGIATDALSFLPNSGTGASVFPATKNEAVVYTYYRAWDEVRVFMPQRFLGFIIHDPDQANTTLRTAVNNFLAFSVTDPTNLERMIRLLAPPPAIGASVRGVVNADHSTDNLDLVAFNHSPLRFNWQMPDYVMRFFDGIAIVGLAVLSLVLILVITIICSRLIKTNQQAIGTLRAHGLRSWKIGWRYTWWSLLLLPLPVVTGWVLGLFLPGFLNLVFASVFSTAPQWQFSFWPLLAATGLVLSVAVGTSGVVFLRYLRRSPVEIMRQDFRVQINARFLTWQRVVRQTWCRAKTAPRPRAIIRGRLHLRSLRQLLVFAASIFVVSTVFGLILLIPSSIARLKQYFFANSRYQNEFSYYDVASNAPLSKYNLTFWEGSSLWDRYIPAHAIASTDKPQGFGGFSRVSDYMMTAGLASSAPFATLSNNQDGSCAWHWPYWRYFSDNGDGQLKLKKLLLMADLGNQFFANTGRMFSVASLDAFLATIFHAPRDSLFKNDRLRAIQTMVDFFNGADFRLLLEQALRVKVKHGTKAKDYHAWMPELVSKKLPEFTLRYIKDSPARFMTLGFGWNNILSSAAQDVLTTAVPVQLQGNNLQLMGLDTRYQQQQYLNTESAVNDRALTIDPVTVQKVKHQLAQIAVASLFADHAPADPWGSEDITDQRGNLIYDYRQHILYLPTIINQLANAKLQVSPPATLPTDLVPDMGLLLFRTKQHGQRPLLKQFWVYDDTDFYQFADNKQLSHWDDYKKGRYLESSNSPVKHHYLDPFTLPNAAFNFTPSYEKSKDKDGKVVIYPDTPAFVDYYTVSHPSQSGSPATYQPFLRPYFNFKNLALYLPRAMIDVDAFKHPDNYARDNIEAFFQEVDPEDVPATVKVGLNFSKWVKISPFSPFYDRRLQPADLQQSITLLTKKINLWIFAALYKTTNPLLSFGHTLSAGVHAPNPWRELHIRPRVISIIEGTHDHANLYVNPALALLVGNYSLAHAHAFHPQQLYGGDTQLINGQTVPLLRTSPAQAVRTPARPFWFNNDVTSPYLWSNHKFSRATEPFDMTTYVATTYVPKVGVNNMLGSFGRFQKRYVSNINEVNLQFQKRQFVDNLTRIGVTVATVMIAVVITTCVLATYLICDIFITGYHKFMIMLKMEGYSIRDLVAVTVPIFIPYLLLGWGLSAAFIAVTVRTISYVALHYFNLYIPVLLSWWLPVLTFVLVAVIFASVALLIPWRFVKNPIVLARTENIFS